MDDSEDDIAVIGIGCNFPGGEGLNKFWKVLLEGRNYVADIPAERFDPSFWFSTDETKAGKTCTTKAALIDGFNDFDHKFFSITEAENNCMDPQQKLLLQCTYRALEDAGVSTESISGSRTGVYIGLMNRDYEMLRNNDPTTVTHYNATGTAMSVAANRISFTFNLTGPSMAVDSACSSSMVALHLACQAIKQGDCEMSLCGGVNCIIEPRIFVALSKARMISPGGTSKPFSSEADGYGRGEGCGVVLLKPLRKAVKDYNKIWGIISKTAVNQDGHSVTPITKPSVTQQEELLRRIYTESDLANVQYIEAHGTGTKVGDPTEAESISNTIAKARPPGSRTLWVGSVKSNIGHTESAAGVAGLIKVLLMMKHKTIVPSVFYSKHSSSIDVEALGINIPTSLEKWETNGSALRTAGINSFGFGGTNAHAIVKEYRRNHIPTGTPEGSPELFVISAASEKSLMLTIRDSHQKLGDSETVDLHALSYTSTCRRTHYRHKYRKAFLTTSISDLQHQLESAVESKVEPTKSDIQVVFLFCGNGVAYKGMCQQLLKEVPVFKDKVMEIERLFQHHQSYSITQWLADGFKNQDFRRPDVVQPVLFAVQVGITTVLKHWGLEPDAVFGHSVGEVAAAHCSGLLSLEDAVKVLYHRSDLQSKVMDGAMLVVSNVAVEEVEEILKDYSERVSIAAFNSPESCTLAGDSDELDIIQERLKTQFRDKSPFLHILDVPAAYHSHKMDPILDDIQRNLHVLDAKGLKCKLFSTVTAAKCSDGDFTSGRYWAENIRKPVLFQQTLHAVTKDEQFRRNVVFVEVGPRRVLQRNICETLGNDTIVLASVQPQKDYETILNTLGRAFELGLNVDWHQVYMGHEMLPTDLPVYQFDNSKKQINFEDVRRGNSSPPPSHQLISQLKTGSEYIFTLSVECVPYLWEHKNNGVSIVPGSLYVEIAYASVMASLKPKKPVSLLQISVTFESLFTLTSTSHQLRVTLEQTKEGVSYRIMSAAAVHAHGTCKIQDGQPMIEEPIIAPDVIFQRCRSIMGKREIYSILSQAGFDYGSVFNHLDHVHFGGEFNEAVTKIQVPKKLLQHLHDHVLHPVLLDYFLQMGATLAVGNLTARQAFPSGISSVAISAPLQETMIMYLRATAETPDFLEVCGCFTTTQGEVLVELQKVRFTFLGKVSHVPQSLFFHSELIPVLLDSTESVDHKLKAIVFADKLCISKRLKPHLDPESIIVEYTDEWTSKPLRQSLKTNDNLNRAIFIWGVENINHLTADQTLETLVSCCEKYRQILLLLKEMRPSCDVHVITYRSSELTVDHISPGFMLSGMTRACAAEMPSPSFQLVDLASVTNEDIHMLIKVIKTSKQQEVVIRNGQVLATKISQTHEMENPCKEDVQLEFLGDFILQTGDSYRMTSLSTIPDDGTEGPIPETSVEIQLTHACVHSSDYFPVTTSHLNFGRTIYWNQHTSHNHQLVVIDFGGVVTAVGKSVRSLIVGDSIVSCYPTAAKSKMRVPEVVCYNTKDVPFLKDSLCVSYFILVWEILRKIKVKERHRKLTIISQNTASALNKVLALTANRCGWNVSSTLHFRDATNSVHQSHALVFLPPFDHTGWQDLKGSSFFERHVVFVYSSHMPSPHLPNVQAMNSEHVHLHKVDVANVLQKTFLRTHSRKVFNWLKSLGIVQESLPLRKETFQLLTKETPEIDPDCESYFTTKTVQNVVLDHGDSDPSYLASHIPSHRSRQLFKKCGIYIITGGLSGLGLETVKFISHNGGGCIATLSRSILTNEIQVEMELLQKTSGVSIIHVQCDVSVSVQVMDAVTKIRQRFPSCPIKGVFHSAAVLHDALIENLDRTLFQKVLKPKVCGALNLHYATLCHKLDYFVCYSSISSFIGNASQCNYAAANSFLDVFCHYRRNLGLAGQSINWGPLNLGLLLKKDHFQKFLEAKGMMTMDVWEVHKALKKCLLLNRAQQVICKFSLKNLNTHVLSQNAFLRWRLLALVQTELQDDVKPKPMSQPEQSRQDSVRKIVSDISNVREEELDDDSALCSLGIDSMLAMTLQNEIFQETGVNVPLVKILDPNSSLSTLAAIVMNNGSCHLQCS